MKKQTKILSLIAIIIVIIGVLAISVYNGFITYEKKSIKVGIIGHLTGDYASYGIPMKNAAQLAIEEINEQGGINGQEIQLFIEDDNSDPNKAITSMNKLINVDGVNYIISAQGSGVTSAIIPIAQNNKNVMMITLGSAPGLTTQGEYIFRSVISDSYQGTKINKFLSENFETEKVAGLYLNDAYGVGIRDIINKNPNIDLITNEMFESGDSDFRTQLLKIKSKDPDVLVLVGHQEYPTILKQVHEIGIDATVITSETFKDEQILQKSGTNAEGVYTFFMAEPVDYFGFSEKYEQRFGEDPSAYNKYAYDGTIALIKSLESSDNTEDVKKNLHYVKFNGASGAVGFDAEGDRTGLDYDVYLVKNNNFIQVE